MPTGLFQEIGDAGDFVTEAYGGMPGDGTTDERAALNTLATITMPTAGGRLRLKIGSHRIDSNLTIAKEVHANEGALFKPAAGVTITLAKGFRGSLTKHFDLSLGGAVIVQGVRVLHVEWWGALGDFSVSDSTAINQALVAAAAGTQKIPLLLTRQYSVGTRLNIPSGVTMDLAPNAVLKARAGLAFPMIRMQSCTESELQGTGKIDGNAQGTYWTGVLMVEAQDCDRCRFGAVRIENAKAVGMWIEESTECAVERTRFRDVEAGVWVRYGSGHMVQGIHANAERTPTDANGSSKRGIRADWCPDLHIVGNTVIDFDIGIELWSMGSFTEGCDNSQVNSNRVRGPWGISFDRGLNMQANDNQVWELDSRTLFHIGIEFAGPRKSQGNNNIVTMPTTVTTGLGYGMTLTASGIPDTGGSDYTSMRGCKVYNGKYSLFAAEGLHMTVEDCEFYDPAEYAVLAIAPADGAGLVTRQFKYFTLRNIKVVGAGLRGMGLRSPWLKVIGCDISETATSGLYVFGSSNTGDRQVLRDNIFRDTCNTLPSSEAPMFISTIYANTRFIVKGNDSEPAANNGYSDGMAATTGELRSDFPAEVFVTLTANSATPTVAYGNFFQTANTVATTITNFPGGHRKKIIYGLVNDSNTTFDFTSNANFKWGSGTVDYSPPLGTTWWAWHDGSAWNFTFSSNAKLNDINTFTQANAFTGATGTSGVIVTKVVGDAFNRLQFIANGTFTIGDGTAGGDVTVGRISAGLWGAQGTTIFQAGDGGYNQGHIRMGVLQFFVGSSNEPRWKFGSPVSGTDGDRLAYQASALSNVPAAAGVITALPVGAAYSQAEVTAIRDALATENAALRNLITNMQAKGGLA